MTSRLLAVAAAGALCLGLLVPATAASAAPAQSFSSCSAVHKVYSGGIAKKGVKYNTTHYRGKTHHRALKGKVHFSTSLYNAHRRLDRNKDGIACEKS